MSLTNDDDDDIHGMASFPHNPAGWKKLGETQSDRPAERGLANGHSKYGRPAYAFNSLLGFGEPFAHLNILKSCD